MESGGITSYFDVAQVVLYLFWIFFAALVIYLHRENKREGYPLDSDRTDRSNGRVKVQGFPAVPDPKSYLMPDGSTEVVPRANEKAAQYSGAPAARFPGAPMDPVGDPMLAGIGPGGYAERADVPDITMEGTPRIVPLRTAPSHHLDSRDPEPRGMPVLDTRGKQAGTISDAWIDLAEPHVRYLEMTVSGETPRQALIPIGFARISRSQKAVIVHAIYAEHFVNIPPLANPDQVTLLEEDKICAYFGGGTLFADAERLEPII